MAMGRVLGSTFGLFAPLFKYSTALALSRTFSASAMAASVDFSYTEQDKWVEMYVTTPGKRQSPIGIQAGEAKPRKDLVPLQFSSGWTMPHDGELLNTGHTAQFNPHCKPNAVPTIRTHLGTYKLLQVHYHWGKKTGEGSEHLFDGRPGELEVHFVHSKEGATNQSSGDFLAVIGVVADVDENLPVAGPWGKLDVTSVLDSKATAPITGFRFDELLPKNRDYYFYEGSLTTPPCSEIVHWFVMKDKIPVPGAYLQQLRRMRGSDGHTVTSNYRTLQELAGRTVFQPGQ